jgi:hypothetical protein
MALVELSHGSVVKGTMFWASDYEMYDKSLIGSNVIRPHLVMNVVDGIALCCPMSRSSDAWNAEVSPHFIPADVNRRFMRNGNSLYAVNVWHRRHCLSPFKVDFVESVDRIDLPMGFVRMANDLYVAFSNDVRSRRLPKVTKVRYKDRRISESVRRIELTTEEVMKEFLPVWKR